MNLRRLAYALVLAGCGTGAHAFTIEYSLDRPAPLVACDKQLYRGARADAMACYRKLIVDSTDNRIKADAARASGDARGANGFFQVAIKDYPQDARVRTRWGELFLATHQNSEAAKLFQEALEQDPKYAPAMLGLAKVAASGFEEKTREYAKKVIDEAPDQAVGAHLLLARAALEDGAIDAGDKEIDKALELVKKHDFSPLEAYALKASVDLLRGTTDSPWTKRALALNAGYGEAYATPAYFYVITRRYREAIDLLNKAVEVEPDLYSAHTELGVNLLRENRIDEAQQHLAIAYRGDPFSAPVVNTLRLIDSFSNFVVLRHEPDTKPGSVPNKGSLLRLHKKEAPVIEPYVLDLVNRTIATYTKRYGFELKEPVVVELYPQHDDFAVRTSGLPGIGLLGVTFGYLVAMDSPARHADSDFHWGTTLWHEMAHVFTLEATRHLVPRWFSEGVSVYEEWTTGPLHGRHIPPPVLKAIKDGKFLPVAELDRGFIRPTYEQQVIVSYMQAGLTCEYVASRFGQAGLKAMLDQFGAGKDTAQAVEAALKITPAQFDKDFKAYVEQQLGTVIANYESWQHALAETSEAVRAKDWRLVAAKSAEAIELNPDFVDQGSPYIAKARAHKELKETALMTSTLLEYRKRGGYDPDALLSLATSLTEANRTDEATGVLKDVLMVAPLRTEVHSQLGDRLLAAGDAADAVVEYKALLALAPKDMADAHYRLAKAYLAAGDKTGSREHLLYALEIAPHYREAQQLLLEVVR
ncbi:MAG TPA: tetratricopeptide repeat protein [Gammaproteobacteria bacterium]|jgi:tetratricopeptide (TPR) repeat protein|nr:tetratricopeptide repeat protein [Gammaproteobacteria bacterium]